MWGGKVKKFSIIFLVLIFLGAPFKWGSFLNLWAQEGFVPPESITITEDTVWGKENSLNFDEIVIDENAKLTIEPGAQINFITLNIYWGSIQAEGTENEPIIFSPLVINAPGAPVMRTQIFFDTYPDESEPSFFRYVKFRDGGRWSNGYQAKNTFWQKALAGDEGDPAISFLGGRATFENCIFFGSQYADFEVGMKIEHGEDPEDYLKIVNSNFLKDDDDVKALTGEVYCDLNFPTDCERKVILVNNWYGDQSGPNFNGNGNLGKKVEGNFYLRGFRQKELIADPLILIPGIMGSMKNSEDEWIIDPMLHTFDDLIESLKINGYQENLNLFQFPYDWRVPNQETGEKLKEKIIEVLNSTGFSRVDLAAHSMGGLVARSYIESDNYQNNVDELLTLGTPHHGSPKAYLQWEAGEGFFSIDGFLAKHHFKRESKHNGFDSIFEYIRSAIPTVQELLPDYDYLYDIEKETMRNYSENYPQNNFLEDLNEEENLAKLDGIKFTNVIGRLDDNESTISKIRVVRSGKDEIWEHGEPENFYEDTYKGFIMSWGDETVPKVSAENISSSETIEIEARHTDFPKKAQCIVLEKLTGKTECQFIDDWKFPNLLYFNLFSPADMQVIDPDGKRVGKNFETEEIYNEITGAFYPGYKTEEEFITIPNPKEGEYKILLKGTNSGEYTVEVTNIEDNQEQSDSFTADIKKDENQEIVFNFSQDKVDFDNDNEEVLAIIEVDDSDDDSEENSKSKSKTKKDKNEIFNTEQNFLWVGMNKQKNKELEEAIYKEGKNSKNAEIKGIAKQDYSFNIFSSIIILGMLLGSAKRRILYF